jgi:prepilin-type processing-associated H-X9-DG protein
VSRGTREHSKRVTYLFADGAVTLYGGPFQKPSAKVVICNSSTRPQTDQEASRNTAQATLAGLAPVRFGLFRVRSPLLTESRLLSLPGGTEMVHFPPFASTEL